MFISLLSYYSNIDKTDGPSSNKKLKVSDTDLEIKSQNKLIFKYRDNLKTFNMNILKELLEYNKQEIPASDLGAVLLKLLILLYVNIILF